MKIAICIGQSSIGGVGTSTYILATGMRRAGHQADILATDWSPGPDYERARRDSWPVEAICIGERWLRRRLEIALNRLSTYDVIINNHSIETKLILPSLPARIMRLSVIRSTNDSVITDGAAQSMYLDALVGVSPEVKQLLDNTGVKCRTEMIANAVMVTPGEPPKLKTPLILAYLGRLTDIDKNILILPVIAKCCNEMGIITTFDVAGDGRDRQAFETKISEFGLYGCMRVLGPISRDTVGKFLGNRHFSIFPSNYEGFGLSLVEAMAAGCVPIASDIPSYRWILGEDAQHLTVPTNNARAYADRIRMISSDPEFYKQIQERLQKRQQDYFSPDNTVNGYLRLIEKLSKTHDLKRYLPVPLNKLPLSPYHRCRCSRLWQCLQICRDVIQRKIS